MSLQLAGRRCGSVETERVSPVGAGAVGGGARVASMKLPIGANGGHAQTAQNI